MSERDFSDRVGGHPRPAAPVDPVMVERAKGALMLRLGVGSPEALGLLLSWARTANTDVGHLSDVLVRGLCRGDRDVMRTEPLLVRWLEARLHAMESS